MSATLLPPVPPLVLDTNIVLDVFVFNDPAAQPVRDGLAAGQLDWIATQAMRVELERVLSYPQIVPRLADQVHLVASESMLYRLFRAAAQLTHRLAEGAPQPRSRPRALEACRPANFYRRTIRYLRTGVRGSYFYPCLFVDVFSRKIVGWRAVRQRGC